MPTSDNWHSHLSGNLAKWAKFSGCYGYGHGQQWHLRRLWSLNNAHWHSGTWNVPKQPSAWTADTRQDGCMLSCCLCQILTLPSGCHSRNRDSSNQAMFFQFLLSNFGEPVQIGAWVLSWQEWHPVSFRDALSCNIWLFEWELWPVCQLWWLSSDLWPLAHWFRLLSSDMIVCQTHWNYLSFPF